MENSGFSPAKGSGRGSPSRYAGRRRHVAARPGGNGAILVAGALGADRRQHRLQRFRLLRRDRRRKPARRTRRRRTTDTSKARAAHPASFQALWGNAAILYRRIYLRTRVGASVRGTSVKRTAPAAARLCERSRSRLLAARLVLVAAAAALPARAAELLQSDGWDAALGQHAALHRGVPALALRRGARLPIPMAMTATEISRRDRFPIGSTSSRNSISRTGPSASR